MKRLRPISRDVRRSTDVNRDLLYESAADLERDGRVPYYARQARLSGPLGRPASRRARDDLGIRAKRASHGLRAEYPGAREAGLAHAAGARRCCLQGQGAAERSVVDYQCATVLGLQARALASVNDWDGLDRWAEAMVSGVDEQGARGGCSIGTLAAALSGSDERLRRRLSEGFTAWARRDPRRTQPTA